MKIVDLTKDYAVIVKPIGMPSQSDTTGDSDAMSRLSELLGERGEDKSLWLVHRLDRGVGGLMVYARSREAAASLSASLGGESFTKEYLVISEGRVEGGEYTDLIYKDARISKAFVVERRRAGVKEARLVATPLAEIGRLTLVKVKLLTGRYHQIRVQLASRGTPLVGDGKYGSRDKGAHTPSLFAYHLSFVFGGKRREYYASPDVSAYPWSVFEREIGGEVSDD